MPKGKKQLDDAWFELQASMVGTDLAGLEDQLAALNGAGQADNETSQYLRDRLMKARAAFDRADDEAMFAWFEVVELARRAIALQPKFLQLARIKRRPLNRAEANAIAVGNNQKRALRRLLADQYRSAHPRAGLSAIADYVSRKTGEPKNTVLQDLKRKRRAGSAMAPRPR
jgi:hypothetical protein